MNDAKPSDTAALPAPTKRNRFRRLRWISAAMLTPILVFVVTTAEGLMHGPLTTAFNEEMGRRARDAGLMGSSQNEVERVLGPATFVWSKEADVSRGEPASKTFNFARWSWVPAGVFQVHCANGVVVGLEQLDD